jgi:hypothetical protein
MKVKCGKHSIASPLFPMSSQLVPHRVLNTFPESSQCIPNAFPEVQKRSALDVVLSALCSSQLLFNV